MTPLMDLIKNRYIFWDNAISNLCKFLKSNLFTIQRLVGSRGLFDLEWGTATTGGGHLLSLVLFIIQELTNVVHLCYRLRMSAIIGPLKYK